MNRVVITGLGCLTPIGSTPAALWQSLMHGRSGIAHSSLNDPTLKFTATAQLPTLDTTTLTPTQLQTTERCAQLAILAARHATQGIPLDPQSTAIVLGCSTNGRQAEEPETAKLYTRDARVHPLTIARSMASNGTSQVAIDLGVTGPAFTVSTACASGAHAIGLAFQMVRSGLVTAALAGAHEAPLTRGFLRAWDSMRVVSPTTCRPFAADRDGMILAEGAAILHLETLPSALARNARIYAEIVGFGMSTDAHHITQPKPEGPAQAITACLKDGHLSPDQIDYINAHGTATQANDATETAALHLALGAGPEGRAASIPLSSTKGHTGHSLGASSAIETLITALALHHRLAPPTLNTLTPDPTLALNLITRQPLALPPDKPLHALTNALAFGGLNAVLALRSYP